jgi:two-component system, LytTR family, sensor kinase
MRSENLRTSRVVALALVVGAFFTAEEALMDLAGRRPQLVRQDLVNGLEFWLVWALLTPLVAVAVRRWPLGGKPMARPFLAHATLALVLAVLHNVISLGLRTLMRGTGPPVDIGAPFTRVINTGFVWGVFTGVVFYAMIVLVYTALRFRRLYAAEQVSAAALEAELARSKLDTLRSQLRPHFLFNTLNAISVFVTEDAAKAQQMLLRLSTLLRRSLDEEAHEVPLRHELGFVNDYLDIQRGRFGDQLAVDLTVDADVLDARVPVFLLQPLFENAIEHGKSDSDRTTIALAARREHDMLRIEITDDGPGLGHSDLVREGIGLRNTRARLHHLYGPRANVTLGAANGRAESSGTRVEISIPFQEAAP